MNPRIQIVAAYALMCSIWGTTWLGIKIGLRTMPPVTGVGIRFVIGGLFLYALAAIWQRPPHISKLPWKLILILSATLFGLNYVLTYTAETGLSSGLVAVLFGTLPFFMFAFGHFMLAERTTVMTWVGAALAFAGVAVISIGGSAQGSVWYIVAAVAAAVISAFANVYAKRHSDVDPLIVLPPSMLIAGIVLAIVGFAFEHPHGDAFGTSSLLAILYLAIFGSGIAFFLNLWLLQRIDAGIVGLSALIIPVIAVFVGILFGGEAFGIRDLLGAALVVVGVGFALTRPRHTAPICPIEG
ncbi:MAG: EamA family transporter [Candidatus Eremiobacteraeota bacterium]|nr:EamA family transporter [Candidatus Eremiobacteraeota bacterium]